MKLKTMIVALLFYMLLFSSGHVCAEDWLNNNPLAESLTTEINSDVWSYVYERQEASRRQFNKGFQTAIDCYLLVGLEMNAKGEPKTLSEISNICRQRFGVDGGKQ